MSSHRWEEYLPEDFYAEMERAPLAYFSAAAPEEHGLHNPLGTDLWQGYEICQRAAEITGGIVFPMIPFAPAHIPGFTRQELRSGEKKLFPPSLFVSRELCELAYTEVLEGVADMGFKACIAVGGHWPADLLLQEITKCYEGVIRGMKFWGGGTVSLLGPFLADLAKSDPLAGGHGTLWETSLVMAIRPDLVDLPRAERILANPLASQLQANSPEVIAHIAQANREFGEQSLQAAVEAAVKHARELIAE
jgi:creatinine amidohydrolase/Fe(II)-dependent formamide hydrolase-like protein